MEGEMKDLIILGAGPAGLGASIYASRYKIDHIIIGKEPGGYLNEIHRIENYLGFEAVSGIDLGAKMRAHVENLGVTLQQETATKIEKIEGGFSVITEKGTYQTKKLLYTVGTSPRRLDVPGEKEFFGKGVSYCSTCDGPFFRNKKVAIVGGGDSAAMAALMLAEYAESVVLIHRGSELTCMPIYLDSLLTNDKIKIEYSKSISKIEGENVVKKVILKDNDGIEDGLEMDGVFIEIGSIPNQKMLLELGAEVDEKGFIKTGPNQSTSVDGIYAAGDITTNSNGFRQVITAVAEGAVAAVEIFRKLKEK